jgi:cobalt-zinc-cadmium efflux system protein
MGAGHDHSHPPHVAPSAQAGVRRERILLGAIGLTLAFAVVEAVGGWWAGSLALLADAGHMLTDAVALLLAWAAARLARRPANARMSYGYRRAEVIAALLNAALMLGIILALAAAAIDRLHHPRDVSGPGVMAIAAFGLLVNLAVLRVLHADHSAALNTRGARLHVLGDLLGSVAALLAGTVIWLTGWTPIDPLLGLFIALLILVSALRLLRDVLHVLMEGVPAGVALERVRQALLAVDGVVEVHDLHVWTLAGDRLLLSAHLAISAGNRWPRVLVDAQRMLRDEFGIGHATLQPEPPEYRRLLADCSDGGSLDDHAH